MDSLAFAPPSLEAVRALHQTVVALRSALEQSKREIVELKTNEKSFVEPPQTKQKRNFEAKVIVKRRNQSLESLFRVSTSKSKFCVTKTVSFADLTMNDQIDDQLDQDQEVDDIELIFTTDDTKASDFEEQLVSIDDRSDRNLLHCPQISSDLELSDRELDDDVFNNEHEFQRENSTFCNSKSDNSINNPESKSIKSCYSYQDSSFENRSIEKDESFDRFDERIRIVETDISKCGIQDVEYVGLRRNTCPNPLQYRPLLHREALKAKKSPRPILAHSSAVRREAGAQTDISALPGAAGPSWLSESNLVGKKGAENFATLPSKYPMPGSRLRLSEKTVEARRVLLSDIGFTSMVPELSRSADHLFHNGERGKVHAPVSYGQFLKTGDYHSPAYTSQKFTWTTTTASPSDVSYSNSLYPLPSPSALPSRRCSAPVSPSRRANPTAARNPPPKVRFANTSLPELYTPAAAGAAAAAPAPANWSTFDSGGDSTDSLVEEAENYLRRSIDCILSSRPQGGGEARRAAGRGLRRASAPDANGDNVPPAGWQPFLPRVARDLKLDHWVKVITGEGRVRGGRVRYIGPVVGQQGESFVGVQLGSPDGCCDGTFSNRRYFQCEPYHGIFVPFKKVIMGWRP